MTSRLAALAAGIVLGAGALAMAGAASLNLTSQALTPYRTCTVTATPSTTTRVADASVRQVVATTAYGTNTTVNVASSNGANRRLYLRFDLTACNPAIPATAVVRTATIRLYVTALPTGCRTYDLFRVTAAWVESTITWNNQPFGAAVNNPASGTRTGSFNIGTTTCQNQTTGTYTTGATVTSDVAAFVAGSATNNGWMIRDDVENAATAASSTFSAKELNSAGQAPQLVVTYVTVP